MEHLLENPHFWTSLALILLLALIGKKVWAVLSQMLDKRAADIKDAIGQAETLLAEAKSLLDEYRRKQQDAATETAAMIRQAKNLAEDQIRTAKNDLEASLSRRTKAGLEKIRQAEANAVTEIRDEAARLAVLAAEDLIRSAMDAGKSALLVDRAINELPSRLN